MINGRLTAAATDSGILPSSVYVVRFTALFQCLEKPWLLWRLSPLQPGI